METIEAPTIGSLWHDPSGMLCVVTGIRGTDVLYRDQHGIDWAHHADHWRDTMTPDQVS